MARQEQTGRTGYDATTNTQTHPQVHSLHGFTQAALETSGVSVQRARELSYEQVAQRAFELYEQSGCQPGRCAQNWAQAEQDLKTRTPRKNKAI
jgi:hypothetical protein